MSTLVPLTGLPSPFPLLPPSTVASRCPYVYPLRCCDVRTFSRALLYHALPFQFLMKYLATFDGASAAELTKVKAAAVKGCIGAVKAPIVSFTEQVYTYSSAYIYTTMDGNIGTFWTINMNNKR